MIAQVRGRLVARRSGGLVVDVHGVGYLLHVPPNVTGRVGEEVELHTSLQVREDSMTLYGFASSEARDLFEAMLSASGVGPKLALAALSTHAAPALRRALVDGDVDALNLVPGVGKKLAQRLVLELKEKLGGSEDLTVVAGGDGASATPISEVRLALLELGYSPTEASRAIESLDPDGEVSDLLRAALRTLAHA